MADDFTITIDGTHGQGFACAKGDTFLSAALRHGIGFPYECNSGGCGSCQFDLIEGDIEELWPDAPGLAPRSRERGRRLGCQASPMGDCTIKVRAREDLVPAFSPLRGKMTLLAVTPLTDDMAEFAFQSDTPAAFLPGQFAMLRFPDVEGARAYSMSNLANESREWHFVIKRVPSGKGTAVLFDGLQVGDSIAFDGPYGHSYLREDTGRDIVCIAGGSGLSPMLSILRGAAQSTAFAGRRFQIFYGGRGPADVKAVDSIADDAALAGRVNLHLAISDAEAAGAAEWAGARGFIHDVVRDTLGEGMTDYDFYFCGPPPMTDAVHRMMLLEFKVPGDQLHFDRFF